jgi:hypothetical protein
MSQENTQSDTPQEGTNEQQYNSLEEAVFSQGFDGSDNTIESAFTDGNEEVATEAPQGQPSETQVQTTEQPVKEQPSNDDKRYQYWQSQADKYKNELDSLRSQQVQPPAAPPAQPPVQQEAAEEFPPPPPKPQRPRHFNRDEAYADPQSDSARYLDDVEEWRDDMSEYNNLKTQYQGAIMEEKLQDMQQERVREAQRQQYQQERDVQSNKIKEHVMGAYGMSETETTDFMNRMSDPKSLTIDNLVQLYRIQQGGGVQQQQPAAPSSEFQQVQNAQQVPSPMGVMPSGQSNVDGRSAEDKIMDTMIGNFNSKNPWK